MDLTEGIYGRKVRVSEERLTHIADSHPEMNDQVPRIEETLSFLDNVVESNTDNSVELYYRKYENTPIGEKYLCVILKVKENDVFMLTAYFTDTIKRGRTIWKRK